MGKKFSRLKWAVKANGGSFSEGDLKQFSDYYEANPELEEESDLYPHLIPVKVKSFYSGFIYETVVSKKAKDNLNTVIDLGVLNWVDQEGIIHDQFIPAKIQITKIGDPVTKTSKITGWNYTTKVQGRYTFPIGQSTNNPLDMVTSLQNAIDSAKAKNIDNLIEITPERWI